MSKVLLHIRNIFLWVLGIVALAFSFFSYNALIAQDTANYTSHSDYINIFYNTLKQNGGIPNRLSNRKGLVAVFCNTIYNDKLMEGFMPKSPEGAYLQTRLYSPKDSVFLFLMCNSIDGSINTQDSNNSNQVQNMDDTKAIIKLLDSQIAALEASNPNSNKLANLITARDNQYIKLLNTIEFKDNNTIPYIGASYIKKKQIQDIQTNSNCGWSSNLNNCPLSTYLSKVFNTIINDYTNSKVASLYGYVSKLSIDPEQNSLSLQKSVSNFSDTYFEKCTDTKESQFLYINKDQIENGTLSYCSHPNTYKVLTNYIENAQIKVQNNAVLDYNAMINSTSKAQGSLLYRGLATECSPPGSNTADAVITCSLDDFQHLVLNELMFYSLFMQFYSSYITTSEQFGPLTLGQDKAVTQEILDEEQRKSQLEMEIAIQAIQQDFKIIRNLYAKFPIHIGMVAYLEDLVNFRNELVKLYTPIHQMYYKLRNAQTYDK